MTNKEQGQYFKKEITLAIAFICLVVGFLGGIVFSSLKSDSGGSWKAPVSSMPSQQQPVGMTAQQASQILALEREVAANPDNVSAWTELGNVYYDTNKFQKSITAYNKSLELAPNNANVLTDLGVMYRRNGQYVEAVESFDKAAKIDPRHQQSRFNKGIVLMYDLKDEDGAIQAWEEVLAINPMASAPNGQTLREMLDGLIEAHKDHDH